MDKVKAKNKKHLEELIKNAFSKNINDLNFIDTSLVTSMSKLFHQVKVDFNVSTWDVSNVRDMSWMFRSTNFNRDLSKWDVSNVCNMSQMFQGARHFDQDISQWNVSNVTDMSWMFHQTIFNQDISTWDVSNVTQMIFLFEEATAFNQDISQWNVSNVKAMNGIFFKASSFNQDLSEWDLRNIYGIAVMFKDAEKFEWKNIPNALYTKYRTSKQTVQIDSALADLIHTLDETNLTIALSMAYATEKLEEVRKYIYKYIVDKELKGQINLHQELISKIDNIIQSL